MLLERGWQRWQEHFATAGVILLGVLAVLSFGLVVRARSADRAAPAVTTPALAEPTAAQLPIPLPSASPSMSVRPVNSIVTERVPIASTVDLAADGEIDWVHWGEQGRYTLERKADGDFVILEGTPDETRTKVTNSPQRYRWTGGSPLAQATGVTSGVRTCGAGKGFTLTAPATTERTTLRLYLGVSSGRGRLQASLSTGGEIYTDRWAQRGTGLSTAAYTLNYRATGAGKISVQWITEESFGGDCGGVVLFAAALR
ncbi:hypothetical protein [Actinoplanes aureus]|uniref:hypothetical protein n=1 Tax=Actinoplanes aureus TaxID=2792083 RepID=UPI002814FF49|nr:hypothetical protein [Actinoplanes aureus]